jgi:hypothetical protein
MMPVGPIVPGAPPATETPGGTGETKNAAGFGLALLMAIGLPAQTQHVTLPASAPPAGKRVPLPEAAEARDAGTDSEAPPATPPAGMPAGDAPGASLAIVPALIQPQVEPRAAAVPLRADGSAAPEDRAAAGPSPAPVVEPARSARIQTLEGLQTAWAEALARRGETQSVPATPTSPSERAVRPTAPEIEAMLTASAASPAEPASSAARESAVPIPLVSPERGPKSGDQFQHLPAGEGVRARVESLKIASGQAGARPRVAADVPGAARPQGEQARSAAPGAASAAPRPTAAPERAPVRPAATPTTPAVRKGEPARPADRAARAAPIRSTARPAPSVSVDRDSQRPATPRAGAAETEAASAAPTAARDGASVTPWPAVATPGAVQSGEPDVGSSALPDAPRAADAPAEPMPAPRAGAQATIRIEGEHGLDGRLRVAVRGEQLRATIIAPDADVAKRMESDLGSLQQALRDRGFTQASVSVRAAAADSAAPASPGQRGEDRSHSNDRTPERDEHPARRDGTPKDSAEGRDPREARRQLR